FFPKWHHVLYLWLTGSPNYDEIRTWFGWWKTQFPPSIRDHPRVEEEWNKGLQTIIRALDLEEQGGPANVAADLLPPPSSSSLPPPSSDTRPAPPSTTTTTRTRREVVTEDEPITFRAVLEAWCADHSLLFVPLREADPSSGLPLFRVTASATGKGGAVVFLRGDVVWVREGKAGGVFRPVGLDEGLLERAEGK
ncbi:MAG: hypothetical protein Q9173_006947, partial [Seirophora scorigena]